MPINVSQAIQPPMASTGMTTVRWANTDQTQAYDPMSKTQPPTTTVSTNGGADNASYIYDDLTVWLTWH